MTMGTFVADVLDALTTIAPDWATWIVGALVLGAAIRIGPRLVKRFM